jgi:hypothetical protein
MLRDLHQQNNQYLKITGMEAHGTPSAVAVLLSSRVVAIVTFVTFQVALHCSGLFF